MAREPQDLSPIFRIDVAQTAEQSIDWCFEYE